MSMTLPRAGTNPGRAANAQAVQPSTIGQSVGDLGKTMLAIGTAAVNDELDRQFKRNQVDLTRDVNNLRLEVEEIGDPDAAEAAWKQGVTTLRETYTAPDASGAPRVDPRNSDRFGLAFDQLANSQSYSLGARNLKLRRSERQATYDRYVYEATRAAVTSDPKSRAQMIAQGEEQIAGLLRAGVVDADGAEALRQDLHGSMTSAAALKALNDDPAAYLERDEAGEFDALAPDTRVRMRVSARNDLHKQAELEAKQAEKAADDYARAVGRDLNRIASLNDTTRLAPDDLAMLDDPAIIAAAETDEDLNLKLRKARARVSLDEEEAVFRTMSPPQLQAVIDEERARKVRHPFQEERLTVLQDLLDSKTQALAADPIGHVAGIGFQTPDLPMDDGEQAFEKGLSQRLDHGRWMQAQGYTEDLVVMTPNERAALKTTLDKAGDPAARLNVITGLARQLGPDAEKIIKRATDDKVSAHVASLIGQGAAPDLMADILTGQKKLADGTATAPAAAQWRETFADITGGMFADRPELEARLQDTAAALYAQSTPVGDSTDIDTAAAESAINRALGGNGAQAGGLVEVDPWNYTRGYALPVPPGVSGVQLNGALQTLQQELSIQVQADAADPAAPRGVSEPDYTRLRTASVSGNLPDFGDAAPSSLVEDLKIMPVWSKSRPSDHYIFVREVAGGEVVPLEDDSGAPYVFSLRRLIGGSGQ